MFAEVWTIVLAAGAGRRLAGVTGGTPKQFWKPAGTSLSLLEATLARTYTVTVPERTVVVVDRGHRPYVDALFGVTPAETIVQQPENRGTAAGVLLPLLSVLERAGDAIVVITPCDHAFDDEDEFRTGITRAISRVRRPEAEIVLFGVEPSSIRTDFGWITPDADRLFPDDPFQLVGDFVENPGLAEAFHLFGAGGVWNTMVLVARGSALIDRLKQQLPFLTDVLTTAMTLEPDSRASFLREWYPELPRQDFSRDLLTTSRPLSLYTWPVDAGWSDLGTPERLDEWLASRAGLTNEIARIVDPVIN